MYIASYNATHSADKALCCTTEQGDGMGPNGGNGYYVGQNGVYSAYNGYILNNNALKEADEDVDRYNEMYWKKGKTFWLSSTSAATYDSQYGGNVLFIYGNNANIQAYTLVRILFWRKWNVPNCMLRF